MKIQVRLQRTQSFRKSNTRFKKFCKDRSVEISNFVYLTYFNKIIKNSSKFSVILGFDLGTKFWIKLNWELIIIKNRSIFYYASIRSLSLGAPFWDVFLILVASSLSGVLRLSNITPGRSEAKVVGRNTRRKGDNKKNFKNHIIGSIITSKDFL